MSKIDPQELLTTLKTATTDILKKDITTVSGFSESQLKLLAQQAAWIAEATLKGEFAGDDALRDHFLKNLEQIGRNFIKVLQGLAAITIEKLWNAVVNVVWGAIDKAVGFALPRP